jgi:two-component system KDP operon response regulator KdpE
MTESPSILVIEDELPIQRFLRAALTSHDYEVIAAHTGAEGLRLAVLHRPQLAILDLGLPDMDGATVITRLREWTMMPIIVLTARGQEREKIAVLDAGADDYMTKPFGAGELLARMRTALRHAAVAQQPERTSFAVGDLRIDLAARQVFVAESEIHLTPIEYGLLAALARSAGKTVTHLQLLRTVWGPQYEREHPYLRVYISNLRRKLEADPARPRYLITEPGVGYRLRDE